MIESHDTASISTFTTKNLPSLIPGGEDIPKLHYNIYQLHKHFYNCDLSLKRILSYAQDLKTLLSILNVDITIDKDDFKTFMELNGLEVTNKAGTMSFYYPKKK